MIKENKFLFVFITGIILVAVFSFMVVADKPKIVNDVIENSVSSFLSFVSFNTEDTRPIGYEFLDDGEVVHIWNSAGIGNYFFNKTSGVQFSNHYEDYWTHNVFCLGYYNDGVWNKIACADELDNFNRSIITDNETFVNATLWKDISYGAYDLRMGLRYHLGLYDNNLTIQLSGENIGIDIPFDLGFAWVVNDIKINGDEENDRIFINDTYYNLHTNETIDLSFTNLDESYYKLEDDWYVRLNWNNNLNYKVEVKNSSYYNARVSLGINAGTLSSGQTKSTTLYWQDPPKAPAWSENLADSPDPVNVGSNITYTGTGVDDGGDSSDPYALYVCHENSIDGNTPAAGGTCNAGAGEMCHSSGVSFGVEATCNYTAQVGDVGTKTGYGFLCGADGRCSASTSTTTTVQLAYGWLNVSIQKPDDDSNWYEGNTNLTINATVTCEGEAGAVCGNVSALARYNLSASPDTAVNTSVGGEPFWAYGDNFHRPSSYEIGGAVSFPERGYDNEYNDTTTYAIISGLFSATGFLNYTYELSSLTNSATIYATAIESTDGDCKLYNYTSGESVLWFDLPASLTTFSKEISKDSGLISANGNVKLICYSDTSSVDSKFYDTYVMTEELWTNIPSNPQSSPSTISQGESWNVSWALNITSSSAESYLLDVLFNSTTYPTDITANNTADRQVNLNPSGAEDTTSPTYSNAQSNNTQVSQATLFSILFNDNTALHPKGQYIFSTNNTGTWVNESAVNFTATPNWANVTKILNSTSGIAIGYRWYADDNAGNLNYTEVFVLETTSDSCTYSSGDWVIDCSDNCVISDNVDVGGNDISITGTGTFTTTANITNWADLVIRGTDSNNICQVYCYNGGCFK